MSRFKEKRRIDKAIEHRNMEELEWSLNYCKVRLKHSTLKEHEKNWLKTIKNIERAMGVK